MTLCEAYSHTHSLEHFELEYYLKDHNTVIVLLVDTDTQEQDETTYFSLTINIATQNGELHQDNIKTNAQYAVMNAYMHCLSVERWLTRVIHKLTANHIDGQQGTFEHKTYGILICSEPVNLADAVFA